MLDSILVSLGLSKGATVGGFFGSVVSLKFIDGPLGQRLTTAACGWLCAAYLAPLILEVAGVSLSTRNELAVAFLVGLFGMSLVAQILKALPEWGTAIKERITGGGGK